MAERYAETAKVAIQICLRCLVPALAHLPSAAAFSLHGGAPKFGRRRGRISDK
jgi:hypothetical protein